MKICKHKGTGGLACIYTGSDTWIDSKKRKPKLTDEYNVVWILDDNEYPTSTTMEWNSQKKQWIDILGSNTVIENSKIIYWQSIPKAPKGIPKELWYKL